MDRRPSIVSVSSLGSISGLLKPAQLHALSESPSQDHVQNGTSLPISRNISMNGNSDMILEANAEEWDPDELFTKHTVAEVKLIQQRLRSDADAKQEELRLMVGERYRDLLQASTSIISIAESSKRVVSTLENMQRTASSTESVHSPKAALSGQGDSQLQMLQSLAAHMKLLLDAPEHLWRLLERKLYLYAAWLFLLSRVVHRSLLREHDEEDAPWISNGIDIGEQFPLVQRQWDAVSQFRSQITQKATSSLRESNSTPVEVCATLLTLHLLESRPLPETLATFLSQRDRTLYSVLSENLDSSLNGSALLSSKSALDSGHVRSRKVLIREVRQKLKAVLEVVSRTLNTARTIFIEIPGKSSSLMRDVLKYIQTDESRATADLPAELRITTQSLLSSLPSANHFILLPLNVRSYRPYMDGASLLAPETSGQLHQRLEDWFQKALQQVQHALENLFADLQSIREVWQIRKWVSTWIHNAEGLRDQERTQLGDALDTVCKQRAISVWKTGLNSTVAAFRVHLESSLLQLETSDFDTHPVQYLFRAPALPPIQAANLPAARISFQKFKGTLQSQIACRAPLLDDVLSTIENGVKTLHHDMDVIHDDQVAASALVSDLSLQYRRDARVLCSSVSEVLEALLSDSSDDTELFLRRVTFIGRTANELSTSSIIFDNLECDPNTLDDFRTKLRNVSKSAISRRQRHDITMALETYHMSLSNMSNIDNSVPHPSSALIESLLSLTNSLQQAGSPLDVTRQSEWASEVLGGFVESLFAVLDEYSPIEGGRAQCVWDLAFLLQLTTLWAPRMAQVSSMLHAKLSDMSSKSPNSQASADMSEYLSRMQHLLGVLLPACSLHMQQDKSSSLLQFGLPSLESQYHPTLQLVKPSTRFGLLLVGSSFVR